MRIRTIKPEFYMNDELAALPATTRILFTGLWGLADCEGRLEDKPKRIKLQVLPYDDVDIDAALQDLHDAGFIFRYEIDGQALIEVINFKKHQRISGTEAKSSSVLPQRTQTSKAKAPRKHLGKHESKSKSTEENCDSSADFQGSTQEALWHAGKEGKGKERKGENVRAAAAKPACDSTFSQTPESPPAPPEPAKPPPTTPAAKPSQPTPRPRNELVDAIISATGGDPIAATGPAQKLAGVAVAEIRKVRPDLTPQLIDRAAKAYTAQHRDWPLTPKALANHWHELGAATAPPKPLDPLDPNGPEPTGNWRAVMTQIFDLNDDALDGKKWAELPVSYRRDTLRELHPDDGRTAS